MSKLFTDGVIKGGLFDAQTGNPWCHKDCGRIHPNEILKMLKALQDGAVKSEITLSKAKYTVAATEKDNTLMHAFSGAIPMVMKVVSTENYNNSRSKPSGTYIGYDFSRDPYFFLFWSHLLKTTVL